MAGLQTRRRGNWASPQKATKFTKSWPSGKKTTKERILTADYADYAENGRGWQGFKRGGGETGIATKGHKVHKVLAEREENHELR
jgi:hypothetical protein